MSSDQQRELTAITKSFKVEGGGRATVRRNAANAVAAAVWALDEAYSALMKVLLDAVHIGHNAVVDRVIRVLEEINIALDRLTRI